MKNTNVSTRGTQKRIHLSARGRLQVQLQLNIGLDGVTSISPVQDNCHLTSKSTSVLIARHERVSGIMGVKVHKSGGGASCLDTCLILGYFTLIDYRMTLANS